MPCKGSLPPPSPPLPPMRPPPPLGGIGASNCTANGSCDIDASDIVASLSATTCVLVCDSPAASRHLFCTSCSLSNGTRLTLDPLGAYEERVLVRSLRARNKATASRAGTGARNLSRPLSRTIECMRRAPLRLELTEPLKHPHNKGEIAKVPAAKLPEETEPPPCDTGLCEPVPAAPPTAVCEHLCYMAHWTDKQPWSMRCGWVHVCDGCKEFGPQARMKS